MHVPMPWRHIIEVLVEDPTRTASDLVDHELIAASDALRDSIFTWMRTETLRDGHSG